MKTYYQSPECYVTGFRIPEPLLTASNEDYTVDPADPGFYF